MQTQEYQLASATRTGDVFDVALTQAVQPMSKDDYIDCRITAEEACKNQVLAHAIVAYHKQYVAKTEPCMGAFYGPIELDPADVEQWALAYTHSKEAAK